MKKLMTMLAAVAMAFGLYAEGSFISGTTFNSLTAGDTFDGTGDGEDLWTGFADPNQNKISDVASGKDVDSRPDYWSKGEQIEATLPGNNLAIKTALDAPIYRAMGTGAGVGTYFDALVKFTAFDDEAPVPSDGKIAVWIQEMTNNVGEVTSTNFCVSAGIMNGDVLERKTFVCNEFTAKGADWFRLTVKSLEATSGLAGFVVFVDGETITCADAKTAAGSLTLSTKAQVWNKTGALFLSAVQGDTLSDVGFAGQGWVDDLVFTTAEPKKNGNEFAKDLATTTVLWDNTKVTNVVITATGATQYDVEGGKFIVFPTTAAGNVTIAWEGLGKYMNDSTTILAGDVGDEITFEDQLAEAKAAFGATKFETVQEALDAANIAAASGTLTLFDNADALTFSNETDSVVITLDLNGNTVESTDMNTPAIDVTAGSLVIADGSLEGTGAVKAAAGGDALDSMTVVAISGGTFDGAIYADLAVKSDKPKFSYADNQVSGEPAFNFTMDASLTGKTLVENEGYWVVDDKPYFQVKDGEKYQTLAAAIAAAGDDATITLLDDYTLTVASEKAFFTKNTILDLGGKKLTVTAIGAADQFGVAAGVTNVIQNGDIVLNDGALGYRVTGTHVTTANWTKKISVTTGDNLNDNGKAHYPMFDVCGTVVVNGGTLSNAEGDIFRSKLSSGTIDVTVNGGTINAYDIFYTYRSNLTYNVAIAAGTLTGTKAIFRAVNNEDEVVTLDNITCSLTDACQAKFSENVSVAHFLADNYELVSDGQGFYTVEETQTPTGITITITKSEGVADVQTNGVSVVGDLPLEAGTTSIELTLVADGITIPVFKCGDAVTTKTATYDIVDGTNLTFTAEAVSTDDPDIDDDVAKGALLDAFAGEGATVDKINAIAGDGDGQVSAKALAAYISAKCVQAADLAESDYVAASVKLDTDSLINDETEVKIVDLTIGEGGAMTFEVDINDDAAVEAIKNMVKASDDLADWSLEVTATFNDGKVTVTPKDATDKAFMKVVIPQDPAGDK